MCENCYYIKNEVAALFVIDYFKNIIRNNFTFLKILAI